MESHEGQRPKALVFLFSLLPGAGHMYLGSMTRGLQLMSLFFGTLFVSSITGGPLGSMWPMFVAPILWFYSFFESLQLAGRIARGEQVVDTPLPLFERWDVHWGRTLGWALIALGGISLLNILGVMIPIFNSALRRLLGPALLVGIGLWLLLRPAPAASDPAAQAKEDA